VQACEEDSAVSCKQDFHQGVPPSPRNTQREKAAHAIHIQGCDPFEEGETVDVGQLLLQCLMAILVAQLTWVLHILSDHAVVFCSLTSPL
jgi:hypothetical protein